MAGIGKVWGVFLLLGLLTFFRTYLSYSGSRDEGHLIMGAQKDFKLATEGKLMVFDTLVTLDESGNLRPSLATSWQISPDGKAWTIHLGKGVLYHDDTPFNARAASTTPWFIIADEPTASPDLLVW